MNDSFRIASYLFLAVLAGFFLTVNLGDRLLWGDEAETALLASNVAEYGVPKIDDGRNRVVLYREQAEAGREVWVWSPWLDEYLAAGSFLLFGRSTVTARLPFVLIALAALLFLGKLAHRAWESHRIALLAMLFCSTCVPYFLHARQCRYYAVLMLAQVWLLWGLLRIIEDREVRGGLHLAGALAVQFHCNYVIVPGNVLGLLVMAGILHHASRRGARGIGIGLAGLGVAAVPWLLFARAGGQLDTVQLAGAGSRLAYYLGQLHFHVVPLVVLGIPAALFLLRKIRPAWPPPACKTETARRMETALWVLAGSQLLALLPAPNTYFRYLMPTLPMVLLLTAVILVTRVRPAWLRSGIIAVLVSTNLVSVASGLAVGTDRYVAAPFPRYALSVTRTYTDRLEDVVNFLRRDGTPRQAVLVLDPEFPLVFHTGMRVVDARLWRPAAPPDWILPVSPSGTARQIMELDPRITALYEPIVLAVHDSPRGGSLPDPDVHAFFEAPMTEMPVLRLQESR